MFGTLRSDCVEALVERPLHRRAAFFQQGELASRKAVPRHVSSMSIAASVVPLSVHAQRVPGSSSSLAAETLDAIHLGETFRLPLFACWATCRKWFAWLPSRGVELSARDQLLQRVGAWWYRA